ncbi:MAG: gamma carbonic anhydrase family protein [Spirochaetales bacterium]|nr:gamma carbonic anhydrase family protein [Spirochaetales bacterium]
MILKHQGITPDTKESAFIAESADIIGDVSIGTDASVWFNAVIRGDLAPITLGEGSNVQDNAVIHVNTDMPTHIGKGVTIAHSAVIHGCSIEDNVLVGMSATVLDGAVIGSESLVAAGALVSPNKTFPPRSLIKGVPAKVSRTLTDEEVKGLKENAEHYIEKAKEYNNEQFERQMSR